jgi:uncharacterized protein (TIGR02145 family)
MVGMRISILQGSTTGTAVYVETHSPTTNANGLVSIEIGGGTVVSGSFSAINWANGPYYVKTETDPAGGTNYSITGTQQLLSVPYALYAERTGDTTMWKKNGNSLYYNDGKVGIGTTNLNSTAKVEISSTTQGILPPRLTTAQMNAINSPAIGLTVYNTINNSLCFYDGAFWRCLDNSCGTISYGGRNYKTVIIGSQCWLKENLNIGITINNSTNQTNNSIIEKYCYNNDTTKCDVYGGLYQWDEMMAYTSYTNSIPSGRTGICPQGWHIPSLAEVNITLSILGQYAGAHMKSFLNWPSETTWVDNSSGFSAVPGGQSTPTSFTEAGYRSYYWTTWLGSGSSFQTLQHQSTATAVNISPIGNFCGASVRCLKD